MTSSVDLPTFTPPGLVLDVGRHRYSIDGRDLISVTQALGEAGLVDRTQFTDDARRRGTLVHAAIELWHERGYVDLGRDDAMAHEIAPYVNAYINFLAESQIRIDAVEERLADPALGCAGTLDLRGHLPTPPSIAALASVDDAIDVIDVKTGSAPAFVGWQVSGYVQMLPPHVRRRCRRWCLNLLDDATYRLIPLTKRSDETIFLAALTVACARRGWL